MRNVGVVMEQAQLRGAPLADNLCLRSCSCNISDVRGTFERPAIKQNQEVLVRPEEALAMALNMCGWPGVGYLKLSSLE